VRQSNEAVMTTTLGSESKKENRMKKVVSLLSVIVVSGFVVGCASTGSTENTKRGSVTGAVLGAAAGGIIGHQSGRGLEGAAIGAGAGAVGGGVLGSAKDEEQSATPQY
jgi:5'-3' exoribonuclease 2